MAHYIEKLMQRRVRATPEERYAHGRFLGATEDELRPWRQLGLGNGRIMDLIEEEFWQTQERLDESDPELEPSEGILDWSDVSIDAALAGRP